MFYSKRLSSLSSLPLFPCRKIRKRNIVPQATLNPIDKSCHVGWEGIIFDEFPSLIIDGDIQVRFVVAMGNPTLHNLVVNVGTLEDFFVAHGIYSKRVLGLSSGKDDLTRIGPMAV